MSYFIIKQCRSGTYCIVSAKVNLKAVFYLDTSNTLKLKILKKLEL